ncbi:hypothetical protein BLS_001178 [Venturia inaequalis]|uniref:Uncharacterized protein n=2 Tax=Venturia inaequalis TaxID=5025 RepID=A0A8H3VF78_VENIN|nr:hypothetical protein BLS_001178 [Venturia inaequalis]KAE9988937.1 hypothetical protein EG328_005647 [Venturia inaequalis]RDI78578.1 hypothetical protein Vi05172_g11531 [Venturia inaequalis]
MGLISKAMMLGGGYFIAKKLMDKNKKSKSSNNNRDLDQQDYYNNNQNQNRNQQDNYHNQNHSQQYMNRDQKDFVAAPVYGEAQPQLQYGESARQISPAVTGYGDEKARAVPGKSFS